MKRKLLGGALKWNGLDQSAIRSKRVVSSGAQPASGVQWLTYVAAAFMFPQQVTSDREIEYVYNP
jgi:hypothetical protein